jgi:hypothetical protein
LTIRHWFSGIGSQALVLRHWFSGIAFAGRAFRHSDKDIEEITAPIFGAHSCLGL